MPFSLVRRGGGLLKHLHVSDAFSRPLQVAVARSHVRRISFPARRTALRPIAHNLPVSTVLSGQLINTFATKTGEKTSNSSQGTKKKSKATKKKAKKPKAPKKRGLTEKQKEAKKARELRQLIKDLKVAALEPPKKLSENYWNLAVMSKLAEAQQTSQKGSEAFKAATELAKAISAEEKEKFTSIAASNKQSNAAAYDHWIKSHTPLQIKDANLARRRLAKYTKSSVPQLRDDRLVKRPRTAFVHYFVERTEGGDFKHMAAKDITSRVTEEWRGMTDYEKEKYRRLQESDKERYLREYREVYGEDPASVKSDSESS
ncbi:hypothetical protein BDV59DRAFT_176409 [Aspergillus ambiguus]|uniref:uncharacterized protein n=1 Tax=Aspergillus ambiguus TaxID=176160 RepID=UPI003CCD49A0